LEAGLTPTEVGVEKNRKLPKIARVSIKPVVMRSIK